MRSQYLTSALTLIIGGVFIFSAASKLLTIGFFEISLVEQRITDSRATAAWMARLLICFEFFLGIALLLPFYRKKFIIPITIITLLGFTIFLALSFFGAAQAENCGCFGNVVKMSAGQSIFKNIALLGLTLLLYHRIGEDTRKWQIPALLGSVCMLVVFLVSPLQSDQSSVFAKYTDFDQWRKEARSVFQSTWQMIPEAVAFDPVIIDEQDRGSYIAQKIVLNISGDNRILSYLLKPKGKGPFPAVLLLHDHGATFNIGKEKVIAPWGVSAERIKSAEKYIGEIYGNRFIGDELAKRGYVCFAIDALNWGDRGGGGMEGQQALAANMLFLGMSFAGLIAYEDVRSAEFLSELPYVDEDRIAAMGLSMGAYRTWQVAAVSDIIKAGVAICWMATNQGLLSWFTNRSGGNSAYSMLHPGLFNYLDYPDVAGMACPKPMLFYNGIDDKLFSVRAVEAAYVKMQDVWGSQSAADKLVTKLWPAPHEFNRDMQQEAFAWLDEQMQ